MNGKNTRSEASSWILFMMCIGFLIIMLSPKMPLPIVGVIIGLIIVFIGFIMIKKENKKQKQNSQERRN